MSNYSDAVLALAPTIYFRLGENAANTTVADSSGNSNGATASANTSVLAATGLLTNDADKAFKFTAASSQYVLCNHASVINSYKNSFCGWVNPTGNGNGGSGRQAQQTIVANNDDVSGTPPASGFGYQFFLDASNHPCFSATLAGGNAVTVVSSTVIPNVTGQTMLSVTLDATGTNVTTKLYINGVLDTTVGPTATGFTNVAIQVSGSGEAIGIGACRVSSGGRQFFDGTIDEVALWSGTAITQAQWATLYATGHVTPPGAPTISVSSSGGSDTVSVTVAGTAGSFSISGYNLYEGTTPGGENFSTIVATLSGSGTGSFAVRPSPTAGSRKYYAVKTFDNQGSPNLSSASAEVYSATENFVSSGTKFRQAFAADYGTVSTGQSIGATVYGSVGSVLVPHATATEIPGTGVYVLDALLDQAWYGEVVFDAANNGSRYSESFGLIGSIRASVGGGLDPHAVGTTLGSGWWK